MSAGIEQQIIELRGEITALIRSSAEIGAICSLTKAGVESASGERRELWVQVRGYGEKLIEVTNTMKMFSTQIAKVQADIEMLKGDRVTAETITTKLGQLSSDVDSFKLDRAMIAGGWTTAGTIWNFARVLLGFIMGAAPFVILWIRNELAK